MAKLTDKTELTTPAVDDLLHVVDISDTTSDPEGSSKKITLENLLSLLGIDNNGTGVSITINADGSVSLDDDLNVTGGIYSTIRNEISAWFSNNIVGGETDLTWNAYVDGGIWKYRVADKATSIQQEDGNINVYTAPTGVADAAITWTRVLSIQGGLSCLGSDTPVTSLSVTKQNTAPVGTSNPYGLHVTPQASGTVLIDALNSGGSTSSAKIRTYNAGTYNTNITLKYDGSNGFGTNDPLSLVHVVSAGILGSGNVWIGKDNANDGFRLGYDNSSNMGGIQSYNGGVASHFLLNPYGGNIGIGMTTSPDTGLHLYGSGNTPQVKLESSIAGKYNTMFTNDTTGNWVLDCNGSQTVGVDSAGRIGLGVADPYYKVHVGGLTRGADVIGIGLVTDTGTGADGDTTYLNMYGRSATPDTQLTARIGAVVESAAGYHGGLTFETTNAGSTAESMRIKYNGTVQPGSDNTQDFGASGLRWANGYFFDIYSHDGGINVSDAKKKTLVTSLDNWSYDLITGANPVSFVWKDYTTPAQTREIEVQETKIVQKEVIEQDFSLVNGKWTLIETPTIKDVEELVFTEELLFDENGNPIMIEVEPEVLAKDAVYEQKMIVEEVDETITYFEIENGVAVKKEKIEKVKKKVPQFVEHEVSDANGDPCFIKVKDATQDKFDEKGKLIERGTSAVYEREIFREPIMELVEPAIEYKPAVMKQATHKVPVMKTVVKTISNEKTHKHTRKHFGLIAQEFEALLLQIGMDPNEIGAFVHDVGTDEYGIRYSELIAPMIKTIQVLDEKIKTLETTLGV